PYFAIREGANRVGRLLPVQLQANAGVQPAGVDQRYQVAQLFTTAPAGLLVQEVGANADAGATTEVGKANLRGASNRAVKSDSAASDRVVHALDQAAATDAFEDVVERLDVLW